MPGSGSARLIQNSLTSQNNKGGINNALGKEINGEASKIKEVPCKTKKK